MKTIDLDRSSRDAPQGGDEPRLPHERDQSADSQQGPQPPNDQAGRQAKRDVDRGLVDTDEARRAHEVEKPR